MKEKKNSLIFWILAILGLTIFLTGTFLIHKVFPSSTKDSIENKNYSVEKTATDVKIIYPNGGETFKKGSSIKLEWTGGDEKIEIFLVDRALESQGVSVSLADRLYGIDNKGSYDYLFSTKLPTGTYKFEIGSAESGYFNLEP